MSEHENISGEILGNKFQLATTNIVQVLLILLVGGLSSLFYFSLRDSRSTVIAIVTEHQVRIEEQLKIIALNLRVLDHNIANPEQRYPMSFPDLLFPKDKVKSGNN